LFTARDLLLIGGFVAGATAVRPFDIRIAHELRGQRPQSNGILHAGATGFRLFGNPGAFLTGAALYAIGRVDGQRRTEQLGLHAFEAQLFTHLSVGLVKAVVGRARPLADIDNSVNFGFMRGLKDDRYRSMPSGHTASAFALASVVSSETVRWWPHSRWTIGTIVYGAAGLTGISRMYTNDHWASDVLIGGAIGTIVGIKTFKYTHSHPDNWADRKLLRAGVQISNDRTLAPILAVTRR
jgi:membrane-associated phospholipid phosphatase